MTSNSKGGSVGSHFNNDINIDVLWHHSVSGANMAWLMNGTSRASSASLPSLAGWDLEGINDFNGDGETDILWRNYATGENRVWFMNDTSVSQSVNLASLKDPNWRVGGTGDFNADGKTDILWRNYKTGTNTVWLMNGTSRMSGSSMQALSDVNWRIEGTGDFNADGNSDIVWRNYKTGANTVWFMNGTSRIGSSPIQALRDVNWQIEGTGDFNNDGRTDILWRNYSTGANAAWFMNGTSRTSEVALATVKDTRWKPLVQSSITLSQPDLVVQSQYAPSSATLGDTITISGYTKNNGQASAGYSYIRYWLSDDATLNTSTDRYLGEDYVASLSAGSSEYDTFDFTYNSSWGTGTKYIFFQADGYNYVTEGNESNNTAYRTINIAPPSPSVTVTSPNGGNTLQMGQSYNITWSDNFSDNVRIWLYKGSEYLQTIVDSTESDGSYTWTLPTNLTPGSDYKVAVGIPGSTVTVYDFSDNNFSVVAPSQPDLVVQSQYAPSSVVAGDTISISASVLNQGTGSAGSSNLKYYLSNDTTLDANDIYLGYDVISSLTTNGSGSGSHSFTYNSAWGTGTKYILFKADADSTVAESNEFNNVAYRTVNVATPSVTVTSPNGGNTLQMGQSYNITWSDNFSDNVRIELYKGSSLIQTISSSTSSNGSFTWTPPTALVAGNDYRIKISSASNSSVSDYSDSYFTINQPDNGFNIQIDYRFDTQGWFTSEKRAALEAAVNIWESIILDEFNDIAIGTELRVKNPQTGVMTNFMSDYVIDDLVIFVGAQDLSSLGVGGPSGTWYVGSELETRYRGSDFQPWTGSITFDSNTNWFFDSTPLISDSIPSYQYDFVSVAVHEIGHVLGIGAADAFDNLVSLYNGNYYFVGSNTTARNGGYSLPIAPDASHVEEGHDETGATGEAAMDPTLMAGTRKLPTVLDVAILDDIGYDVDYNRAYSNA